MLLVSLVRRLSGPPPRRALAWTFGGLALLLALSTVPASAAAPPAGARAQAGHVWIVSLGDSYTSGNGAGNYYGDQGGDGCHRSYDSYPWRYLARLRASGRTADLWHAACSGAWVRNLPPQVDEVVNAIDETQVDIVVLTVGGNDLGFENVLPCLIDFFGQEYCANVIASAWSRLPGVMAETESAMRSIAARIPNAEIVLLGYPKLTSPSCPSYWNVQISLFQTAMDAEQAKRIKKLNRRVRKNRFRSIPTAQDFTGHGPCAFFWLEWIHDLVLDPSWESFHPNRTGHQVLGDKLFGISR